MARPLQGTKPKKDVTLSLDQDIYKDAQSYAKKRRTSVSSLVDGLLEKMLADEKKDLSRAAFTPTASRAGTVLIAAPKDAPQKTEAQGSARERQIKNERPEAVSRGNTSKRLSATRSGLSKRK